MRQERAPEEMPCPDADRLEPVDLAHLSRYTLGERALERELLELFRAQARLQARYLAQARDGPSWRAAAHTLKGSARSIGAWRVAAAADAAERLTFAASAARREAALAELDRAVAEIETHIGRMCSGA